MKELFLNILSIISFDDSYGRKHLRCVQPESYSNGFKYTIDELQLCIDN